FEQGVGQDYLHVWDTATAQEVGRLGPLAQKVTALAFSRDGRKLAAGFQNGELLVWHPPALDKAPGKQQPYSVSELEQLWSALGQPDSAGYRAAWALVDASVHAVALLNDRLRPVAETDPAQVRRLLADLQSRQEASQANAWADLERLGPGTEPEMRRARIAGAWPTERVRLEAFLKELALKVHFPPPGEPLRRLRAVSVLEW